MPACLESDVGVSSICRHSQIANVIASPNIRKSRNYIASELSHNADMEDEDKNGGPNHLRAWMKYRKMTGAALAEALGGKVTPGMVSDLVNSNRALSAKWLRRLADALDTTPGMLLDHDPSLLDTDIIDIWSHASASQKQQIADLAKVVVKTGTQD